jgi:hypothetical protein
MRATWRRSNCWRVAATFREAFAVLDAVGCRRGRPRRLQVQITLRHLARLERRRADALMSLLARLDSREDLTTPAT